MDRFEKGYDYIVLSNEDVWYMVRQVSQKGWVALAFAQTQGVEDDEKFYQANGVALFQKIKPKIVRKAYSQKDFRVYAYNVLKYGRLEE